MSLCGWSQKAGWPAGAILAGLLAGRLAARMLPAPPRPGGRAIAAVVAAALVWAPVWILPALERGGQGPVALPGPSAPPSVVLVLIDALRADRLGAYGHDRPTSPEMDRLAARGVRFAHVSAPSSWTPPSMASILTSLTVGRHGLVEKGQGLPPDLTRLPARLRDAGYRTAAFTTNPWLKPSFGFSDGFDEYFDLDRLGLARRLLGVQLKNWVLERAGRIRIPPELVPEAAEVTQRGLRWMSENGDRPFFLYLHYMDVHSPYDAVAPFHGRFCSGHETGVPDHILEADFRRGRYAGDEAVLDHVKELYDEEILATDASIGRLADGMREMGLDASTLLIITADHGEEFYEHGGVMHGRTLYQEVVEVPLIAVAPARAGLPPAIVEERVSTLDIFPTVLEMAGLPVPGGIAGLSLAGRLGGAPGAAAGADRRIVASQLFREGWAWTALFLDGDKFIRRRRIPPGGPEGAPVGLAEGAGIPEQLLELYHLGADPREAINAAEIEAERTEKLALVVEDYERLWGTPGLKGHDASEEMDPETLRQLKALGYID
jgi:arylsulfatase